MSFAVWGPTETDFGTLWTTTFPKFDLNRPEFVGGHLC